MGRKASEEFRELRILEELAKEPCVRQMDLAKRLGVAVGTVNWLLKRLLAKGYVKVKRIGHWQWEYLLTPQGLAMKTKLTLAYIERSMELFRRTRARARELLGELKSSGYNQVRLEGDGDLVDICRLTCLEQGVEVVSWDGGKVPVLRVKEHELFLKKPEDQKECS